MREVAPLRPNQKGESQMSHKLVGRTAVASKVVPIPTAFMAKHVRRKRRLARERANRRAFTALIAEARARHRRPDLTFIDLIAMGEITPVTKGFSTIVMGGVAHVVDSIHPKTLRSKSRTSGKAGKGDAP